MKNIFNFNNELDNLKGKDLEKKLNDYDKNVVNRNFEKNSDFMKKQSEVKTDFYSQNDWSTYNERNSW